MGPRRDPFADVPNDVLRRVGQDERDQPYFVIWASEGFVLRQSNPALQVPEPPEEWGRRDQPAPSAIARRIRRGRCLRADGHARAGGTIDCAAKWKSCTICGGR